MRRTVPGILALVVLMVGCGKKGPPLPPLVRVPAAPQSLSAARQGRQVTLRFAVPSTNVDGTSPGDVARVEVFAMNGVAALTADDVVRRGTLVGSIKVNPPPDPDAEDTDSRAPAPPKDGVDQGTEGMVAETLGPIAGGDELRTYVAVAFSPRGRRGTVSNQVIMPMVAAPPAPPAPAINYDASSVTLTWPVVDGSALGTHVYDVTEVDTRLTTAAIRDGRFVDSRIEFDVERCYASRSLLTVGGTAIESEPSPRACVTPRDTFPPDVPGGLNAVPEAGAVSLIWNPVDAEDLAGYIVLRAVAPETTPTALNETPLADTTYRDTVASGARVTYTIVAVDKSGNRSTPSSAIEETVR